MTGPKILVLIFRMSLSWDVSYNLTDLEGELVAFIAQPTTFPSTSSPFCRLNFCLEQLQMRG